MENLGFLLYLACPVGMGLMMWLMMRGKSDGSRTEATSDASNQPAQPSLLTESASVGIRPAAPAGQPARSNVLRVAGLCFDWRVVIGLAALALGVVVLAPALVAVAIPLLIVAACPLSMLLMMRGMNQDRGGAPEIGQLEPSVGALPAEERLAELRLQLATAQDWQTDLARQIAALERDGIPAGGERSETPEPRGNARKSTASGT